MIKHFALKGGDALTMIRLAPTRANQKKGADGKIESVAPPNKLELLQTGMWDTPYHGMFMVTDDDLAEYMQHWKDGLRKGLPIDYEHDDDGGAAGWITNLYIAPSSKGDGTNALWGDIDWTPEAVQQVEDGVYKYFSPEFWPDCYPDPETGELYDNVFIGGGLTNRPLFKNLTSVRASDKGKVDEKVLTANATSNTIYVRKASQMNLKDLLAKAPADLNDEEKTFVVEHKGELSDEQVTTFTEAGVLEAEGETGDGDGSGEGEGEQENETGSGEGGEEGGTQASDKPKGGQTVAISASDLSKLRKQAADGEAALEMLHKKQASETVQGWLFNDKDGGHFPTTMENDLATFYHSLQASQRKAFEKIVEKMPKANLFQVRGGDTPVNAGTGAYEKLKVIAEDMVKANEKLTFSEAIKQARHNNPELSEQYLDEVGAY